MLTTQVVLEGNLAADVCTDRTRDGHPVAHLLVLVDHRVKNTKGEWCDGEPTRHRVVAYGSLAGNVAASLRKGDRVLVAGRMVTEAWTDSTTGEARSTVKVIADAVGASLRWHTASPQRAHRRDS